MYTQKDDTNIYEHPMVQLLGLDANQEEYLKPMLLGNESKVEVTIGDLHANFMKLLHILIQEGIAYNISPENYRNLRQIYLKQPDSISEDDLMVFKNIINGLQFNTSIFVRFIGDVFADRGQNDLFTLLFFKKMHSEQVQYEILFSNHDLEFFIAIHSTKSRINFVHVKPLLIAQSETYAQSLVNLQLLLQKGQVTQEEICDISVKAIEPHVKICSYSQGLGQIAIYSHAPIGLESLEAIAHYYKLDYSDNAPLELTQFIDSINAHFQKSFFQDPVLAVSESQDSPLLRFAWKRDYEDLIRPEEHHGYRLLFVHGHDHSNEQQNTLPNIVNLDNVLGKTVHLSNGTLVLCVTPTLDKQLIDILRANIIDVMRDSFKTQRDIHVVIDTYKTALNDVEALFKRTSDVGVLNQDQKNILNSGLLQMKSIVLGHDVGVSFNIICGAANALIKAFRAQELLPNPVKQHRKRPRDPNDENSHPNTPEQQVMKAQKP